MSDGLLDTADQHLQEFAGLVSGSCGFQRHGVDQRGAEAGWEGHEGQDASKARPATGMSLLEPSVACRACVLACLAWFVVVGPDTESDGCLAPGL